LQPASRNGNVDKFARISYLTTDSRVKHESKTFGLPVFDGENLGRMENMIYY
jgi:hypothetical protein